MPHYCIQSKKPDDENATLRVVEDTLTVRLAEPADFVRLTKANGEIEKAG